MSEKKYVTEKEYEGLVALLAGQFAQIHARFNQVDARFEQVDAHIKDVDGEVSGLRATMNRRFDRVEREVTDARKEMRDGFAAVRGEMSDGFARHDRRLATLERYFEGRA